MSKFKVGDKARCIYRTDAQNTKINSIYTVKGYRENGNVILKELPACAYNPDYFELVEEAIKTTEIKIDSNEINLIAQKDDTIDALTYAVDRFKKESEMKEGNEMIESMNLIDLYASKHKENIERETKEKVEELRKNCDVINKFNELLEQFERECDDLYLSQFTEEERNKLISNDNVKYYNKPLIHSDMWRNKYSINNIYRNDEITKLETDMVNKVEELNDLVKTVKAHVGIAKTKEEVEEILTRYGIIDKKGKLVTK